MLNPGLTILYLHGFASSPLSRKARFLEERLAARGIRFSAPDLASGDFFHLTISKQLEVVRASAAGAERLVIIGSSMGGYLAALYAAEHNKVEQLVLLAPAFGFHDLWVERLGPDQIRNWRESGRLSVFHYGEGREVDLSYQFLADAEKYPLYPDCRVPALIFHGTHDDLVPLANSAQFVQQHPEVRLVELNSGHELTDVLEEIWTGLESCLPPA
jgi:uncharacterized protein